MHSRHEAKGEKQPIEVSIQPADSSAFSASVSVSDVREAMEVDAPVQGGGGVSSKTFKWLLMPTGAILA